MARDVIPTHIDSVRMYTIFAHRGITLKLCSLAKLNLLQVELGRLPLIHLFYLQVVNLQFVQNKNLLLPSTYHKYFIKLTIVTALLV